MATWKPVNGAKGYLLDVSTSSGFDNYVNGYHDLDVGDATGLNQGTTYYYRVRAYDVRSMAGYTQTMAVATVPTTGLTIQATFDSSITGQPKAAVIEATINQAISIYESLFTDPITISIRFRYATTLPDGTPMTDLVESLTVIYSVGSNIWFNALRSDAKSSNDSVAIASLPDTTLFPTVVASSANGRALGQNTPPAMNADGTVSVGGPYDGIVTLNSVTSFQFFRPTDANRFDAQRSIEQGIDSIMGILYNFSGLMPNDLFSWSAPGQRNSDVAAARYFSIDGGVTSIIYFNNDSNGSFADWASDACPQAQPYVQNAFPCMGQFSDVSATSPEGIDLDVIGYDLAQHQTGPPRLGNISTRSFVQTGDNVMIGGFIVQGTGPKRVIIRAIGPELGLPPYNIANALANPTLELHDGTGAVIATNDDWQTTILGGIIGSSQVSDIQNSGHPPAAASESAIIADLQPGNYTAIVRGVSNTTGVALVEVYDLNPAASSSLGNISTRSFVQTGDNVMIGGFIVQGGGPKRVIIRAIGPELTQYGIADALANPTLELHNGGGT
ncbi:MAG TPA: NF038122 family metalloprotease, partial [Candidatus Tectomicrobia bacterium]|nr:NF038122 family metalloprotease [Candidatus Tectomicrobia bacterium]